MNYFKISDDYVDMVVSVLIDNCIPFEQVTIKDGVETQVSIRTEDDYYDSSYEYYDESGC